MLQEQLRVSGSPDDRSGANYCDKAGAGYCARISASGFPIPTFYYKICTEDSDCPTEYGEWCIVIGECYDAGGNPTGRGCVVNADASLGSCGWGSGGGGVSVSTWCDSAHPYCDSWPFNGCQVGRYLWGAPCNEGETCVACPSQSGPVCGQLVETRSTHESRTGIFNVALVVGLPILGGVILVLGIRRKKRVHIGSGLLFVLFVWAFVGTPSVLAGVCERPPASVYYLEWWHKDTMCCKVDCDCPARTPSSSCSTGMIGYCAVEWWNPSAQTFDFKTCSTDADCAGYGDWCVPMGECQDANGTPTGRACVPGADQDPTLGLCETSGGIGWCSATYQPPFSCDYGCATGYYPWGRPCNSGETCVACPGQAPSWAPASIAQVQGQAENNHATSSRAINFLILGLAPLGVAGVAFFIRSRKRTRRISS